jgi:hypothetical protein
MIDCNANSLEGITNPKYQLDGMMDFQKLLA